VRDPGLVVRGTTGLDVDGAHESAVLVQRLWPGGSAGCRRAPWRWAGCRRCARVFFPDREDRTLADRRRGADDAGFVLELVTVRRHPSACLAAPAARL